MIKFLLVGVLVFLMYRFWDSSQKRIDEPHNDNEPDQYTDYEEID